MAKKIDGIIEAVHYEEGKIQTVRVYERRGAAFTDRLVLRREELVERLKSGKKFVTGTRKEFWAGTFETGKPVQIVKSNSGEFIATRAEADRDDLQPAPVL
jgi:hypothetical protein